MEINIGLHVWLRAASKMSLGIASHVYPPAWPDSKDAARLRYLMRSDDPHDETGESILGLYPESLRDDVLGLIAVPPEHIVWFVRGHGGKSRG